MIKQHDENLPLMMDSYKQSHWKQYPKNLRKVVAYAEPRYSERHSEVLWFGLQYYLKRYLEGDKVSEADMTLAKAFVEKHMGPGIFNEGGWRTIVDEHGGKLPISVYALPEGTVVPLGTPLYTIENTDPRLPWLPSALETLLLKVWYPTTVATVSRACVKIIREALRKTDPIEGMSACFMLHDFGYRGSTSEESAAIGGAAHLLNSFGTDTIAAVVLARDYYGAEMTCGLSVPAMEHGTIISWGKEEEISAYCAAMKAYPDDVLSVVVDSYDQHRAVDETFGKILKDEVILRKKDLVIRLDSGDPAKEIVRAYRSLARSYGDVRNAQGFSKLNYVKLLQGDGIDDVSLPKILHEIISEKICVSNVIFGMGSGLLQKVTRDTLGFAQKPCHLTYEEDGKEKERFIKKTPKGDLSKESKDGLLVVKRDPDKSVRTVHGLSRDEHCSFAPMNMLREVFRNGKLFEHQNFKDVKGRVIDQGM